jgi:GNAT superfamily N-acetyltransferase
MRIIDFGTGDPAGLRQFVRFGREIYRGEPRHVPPLKMELLGNRLMGVKGLLAANHPFHEKANVRYFLAERGGEILGRVAACENRIFTTHQEPGTGFFGFFESVDDAAVAHALLDAAGRWLAARGLKKILGPVNFDTTDNLGLLVDGFDRHHYMMTSWNPPYYASLLESWGLEKAMDLIAQELSVPPRSDQDRKRHERLDRLADRVMARRKITLRRVTTKNLKESVPLMRQIYNGAWADNYGFAPITEEDARMLEENLRIIVDQSIIHLAFVDGEPAAFIGALADVNEMIPRRGGILDTDIIRVVRILLNRGKGTLLRLFAFGILPQFRKIGIDTVIYHESFRYARSLGRFETCEVSWLLENNDLVIRAGESMGAHRTKTWRIYEKGLQE